MSKTVKTKKIPVEFYMLFDDNTWDTTTINIPEYLIFRYNETNSLNQIIDWAYSNEKFSSSVCLIGIYSFKSMEEI